MKDKNTSNEQQIKLNKDTFKLLAKKALNEHKDLIEKLKDA